MTYAIIGTGKLGMALASQFARNDIQVCIANTHGPESLTDRLKDFGTTVTACTLQEALEADAVILAIPFEAHRTLADKTSWHGKIVVDAMNSRETTTHTVDGLQSSDAVAQLLRGARVVKTFNQQKAEVLAADPAQNGGRVVMFVAGNDDEANGTIAGLVERLGFAPIVLGKISEGGSLLRFRGPLMLQKLIKL